MQTIETICDHCRKVHLIKSIYENKRIKCSSCNQVFKAIHLLNADVNFKLDLKATNHSSNTKEESLAPLHLKRQFNLIALLLLFLIFIGFSFYFFYPRIVPGKKIKLPSSSINLIDLPLADLVNNLSQKDKDDLVFSLNKSFICPVIKDVALPTKSNQTKSTNSYMSLASQNVKGEDEHFLTWMKYVLYDIPKWQQYWYDYQYTENEKSLSTSFVEFLKLIEQNDLNIIQVAEGLQVYLKEPEKFQNKLFIPLAYIQKEVTKLTNKSFSKLDGAKLIYLSKLLPFYKNSLSWYSTGLVFLQNNENVKTSQEDIFYSYCLIKGVRLAIKNGEKIDPFLYQECKSAAYRLMMRMEPDGSPPQIGGVCNRNNYREVIYFASTIFDLDDLRFVAFNGIENADIMPPSKLGDYFKTSKSLVLRSTWNISWNIPTYSIFRKYNDSLGEDSAQVTIDANCSQIAYFAFNKPMIILELPTNFFDSNDLQIEWAIKKKFGENEYTVDDIKSASNNFHLQFIRETSSFVVEFDKPVPKITIRFNDCEIETKTILNETAILTNHKKWHGPVIMSSSRASLFRRHKGNVEIKTDGAELILKKEDNPKLEGFYNSVSMNNANYLIVSGRPLFYEDNKERHVDGDTRKRILHTITRKEKGQFEISSKNLGEALIYPWLEDDPE